MKRSHLLVAPMYFALALTSLTTANAQLAQDAPKPQDDKSFVPLENVVTVLQNVLTQVKGQIQPGDPQLKSAEFDFQTVNTTDVKGGVIVSIVTLEGEHEKDATREVDFTYSIPPPPSANVQLPKHGGYMALTPY